MPAPSKFNTLDMRIPSYQTAWCYILSESLTFPMFTFPASLNYQTAWRLPKLNVNKSSYHNLTCYVLLQPKQLRHFEMPIKPTPYPAIF